MTTPLLQVRNLTTRFRTERGTVTAVDELSFDVAAGETVAIVGESGSGKSVTALSILRLIPNPPGRIESGEIIFEGRDLLKLDDAEIQAIRGNKIAMIFQEPMSSLNPALTVGLQIGEPINLHRRMPWAQALEKAKELIGRVRIADAASRLASYPHQFSGGMRQRVMIAMALACQPRLVIADEPTTALDVTVQAQILDLLKELTRETGSALILITHDLGVVARYADRVAVMYGGRIVETAPARELYARPAPPLHARPAGLGAAARRRRAAPAWCRSTASRPTSPRCPPAARSRRAARTRSIPAAIERPRAAKRWPPTRGTCRRASPMRAEALDTAPAPVRAPWAPTRSCASRGSRCTSRSPAESCSRARSASVKAVDGVSFAIRRGETLGLVGESGSGKTTTGLAVLRMLTPTAGRIVFEGEDIARLDKARMQRHPPAHADGLPGPLRLARTRA